MKPTTIQVPVQLLVDQGLSSSAKLLWMALQLGPKTSRKLVQERSGLTRPTIIRSQAELEAAGWLPNAARKPTAQVSIPSDLLLDRRVGVQAKLLFGLLQLHSPKNQVTYNELCTLAHLTPKPVRQAVRELQEVGWLQVTQQSKFKPIQFALQNPFEASRQAEVEVVTNRLAESDFKGEALLREILTLVVDSTDFEDNATPGFLINPLTDAELQFDRFYPPSVALEFNGAQHYQTTPRYPDESKLRTQRSRDLMKIGICSLKGIHLVILHAEDLSVATLQQRLAGLLPLRDLDGHEPLVAYLNAEGRRYQRKAKRKGAWST